MNIICIVSRENPIARITPISLCRSTTALPPIRSSRTKAISRLKNERCEDDDRQTCSDNGMHPTKKEPFTY